ncbi:MAG: hypothetical protein ACTSQI_07740 [Candidatus Helarchaeota archaeon]
MSEKQDKDERAGDYVEVEGWAVKCLVALALLCLLIWILFR